MEDFDELEFQEIQSTSTSFFPLKMVEQPGIFLARLAGKLLNVPCFAVVGDNFANVSGIFGDHQRLGPQFRPNMRKEMRNTWTC